MTTHDPTDKAPPAPSRFKAAAATRRAQWVALVDDGRDREAIMEIMRLTPNQFGALAKATGKRPRDSRWAWSTSAATGAAGHQHRSRGRQG